MVSDPGYKFGDLGRGQRVPMISALGSEMADLFIQTPGNSHGSNLLSSAILTWGVKRNDLFISDKVTGDVFVPELRANRIHVGAFFVVSHND